MLNRTSSRTNLSRSNANKIGLLACLICLMCLYVGSAIAIQEVSVDDVEKLIPTIENLEKKLINVYVESEYWYESRMKPEDKWEKTATYMKGKSWYNGLRNSKIRIDVEKETFGSKGSKVATTELSYSVGYDGVSGKKTFNSVKGNGKTQYPKRAELYLKRPKDLDYGDMKTLSGRRFTVPYFFREIQGSSLSGFLKLAISKGSKAKLTEEVFLGADCLKVSCSIGGTSEAWWFDTDKGYALRGYKLINLKNGREWLVSFIQVTKLKKVTKDIWCPVEAIEEQGPSLDKEPYRKIVYKASKVKANDLEFNEDVFDIKIPKKYKKIEKK